MQRDVAIRCEHSFFLWYLTTLDKIMIEQENVGERERKKMDMERKH